MTALRSLVFVPILLLTFASADGSAQGRGGGNGPAFCRNGQGHPVHGWRWCEERGWDRPGNRDASRGRNGGIYDRGDTRTRGGRLNIGYNNGYSDGYEKGLEDVDRSRTFDPTRHGWYRSADRGYDDEYGTKSAYKNIYRDGFQQGYDAGFRDRNWSAARDNDGRSTGAARRRRP